LSESKLKFSDKYSNLCHEVFFEFAYIVDELEQVGFDVHLNDICILLDVYHQFISLPCQVSLLYLTRLLLVEFSLLKHLKFSYQEMRNQIVF
jgi:hypothetical protein